MATSLASQLKALAVAGGVTKSRPSTRPSLLYSPSQAADIDVQTILALALTGLEELIGMDGRFKAFKKTLFNLEKFQEDRELLSKADNEKLDKSISTFLCLLCGYAMLTPSHQTLEYLIRRHKIEVYNVEDVVLCVLPYHETSLFVRVVQLLHLQKTRWQFLESIKNSGAPPPRQWLVKQCTNDMAVLEAICDSAMAVSGLAAKSKATISFTCVLLVETIAEVPRVSSDLVNRIQPLILHSLESNLTEDYRVGALMIIGALANRSTLAPLFVEALFELTAKAFQRDSGGDGFPVLQLHIMTLIQLVQTQEINSFPMKAFKLLIKAREFLPILKDLAKTFDTQKLVALLVQVLIDHCLLHDNYEHVLLEVVNSFSLASEAGSMVSRLLDLSFKNGGVTEAAKSRAVMKRLLQTIERRYPAELDKAISVYFKNSKAIRGDKEEDPLFKFLSEVFHGSLRSPLAESHMSLYLSIDHPQAQIREIAVQQLSKLAAKTSLNEQAEIYTVLREAYLRRLSDDHYSVIQAVLSFEDLVKVIPAERLFQALASIISRCYSEMMAGKKSSKTEVRLISKKAIELLACDFLKQNPSYVEQVALAFSDYLLQFPKTSRLNKYVLEAAAKLPFPLFTDLSKVHEETSVETQEEETKSKEIRRELRAELNRKIIKSLAGKVAKHTTEWVMVLLKSNLSDNSKVLVTLVLLQCFKKHSKDTSIQLVEASLRWLRDEWTSVESRTSIPLAELQNIDYAGPKDSIHIPSEFYHRLGVKSPGAYPELLLRALYSLVPYVPCNNTVTFESDGHCGEDSLDGLFVLFAGSSSMKIFTPHIQLLLGRLQVLDTFTFLSKFFIAEGSAVPAFVQVHSLDVLATQLRKKPDVPRTRAGKSKVVDDVTFTHLQGTLPPLLVALASPLKAVRRSAMQCLENITNVMESYKLQSKKGVKGVDLSILNSETFGEIVHALVDAKENFIASGTYLGQFLSEKLGPTKKQITGEGLVDTLKIRTGDERQLSFVTFFVHHTFRLPVHAQRVLFTALQGIAHGSELVNATHERFKQLVECRKLCHLQDPSDGEFERLTQTEVQVLEVLVQMYTPEVALECSQAPSSHGKDLMSPFLETLNVKGGSLLDPAILQPCCAALKCVTPAFYSVVDTPTQDVIFQALITLSTVKSEIIRSAAQDVLRSVKISSGIIARHLEYLLEEDSNLRDIRKKKKSKKETIEEKSAIQNKWPGRENLLTGTASILEFLLWKSDIRGRQVLIGPLCNLLKKILLGVWPRFEGNEDVPMGNEVPHSAAVLNIQHLVLMILESIAKDPTIGADNDKDTTKQAFDVDTVVAAVNNAVDLATRNYALALLTTLGKLMPNDVLKHLVDILSVVGKSTITKDDNHSHQVVDQMLTAFIPIWLTVEKDPTVLLQVFISALPRVPPHRRLTLISNLLRVTTEEQGLHIFLFLLLELAAQSGNDGPLSVEQIRSGVTEADIAQAAKSLELDFAETLCRHYSPDVRLPAMVKLLSMAKVNEKLDNGTDKLSRRMAWALQQLATKFVADHLRSPDRHAAVTFPDSSDIVQKSYVALMEQVLLQLQMLGRNASISVKEKKSAQETSCALLDGLTQVMGLTEYIKGITSLLKHADSSIRRKALRMYTLRLKEQDLSNKTAQSKKRQPEALSTEEEHFTTEELVVRIEMIKDIGGLLTGPGEELSMSTKRAAIEALDVSAWNCAARLPDVFISSLAALVKNFHVNSRAVVVAAVRCVSTILTQLGPHALPGLPDTVVALFEVAEHALAPTSEVQGSFEYESEGDESELAVAILGAFETLLDKLGPFLTPYLQKIIGLVLLQPQLITGSVSKLTKKAAILRTLIPAKIPVRLLLDPLMSTYKRALEIGEDSACALFEMLATMTATLDRPAVVAYHGKIFDFCLAAFDIRRQAPSTIVSVSKVETALVTAVTSLVMKLSETTFKPIFVKMLEWAESEVELGDGSMASRSVDRNILFYKLVNHLTEKLRSVFVPYFQYLLDGCVHHLTSGANSMEHESWKPKKKKRKQPQDTAAEEQKSSFSSSEWNLRQLVLSSLHKCFLYDTVNFLDATKFQLLLEPVVTQLAVDPPTEVTKLANEDDLHTLKQIPSLREMDDTLVSCLGQMALTAGTDLLWKPLNHEVLMRTRLENERTRLLGLRVVKFLAEHLKEEYLVLLPETIPFLAELLEDTELTVVAQTQEVVKLLEDLSGEDLSQYF